MFNVVTNRRSWPAAGRRALLMLVAFGAAATPIVASPATLTTPPATESVTGPLEIQAVELHDEALGVQVEVSTSGELVWTSYRDANGNLVVELPNSRPVAQLAELDFARGMVESAKLQVRDEQDGPLTQLVVRTTTEAEHFVAADGSRLVVDVTPLATPEWPNTGGVRAGEQIAAVDQFDVAAPAVASVSNWDAPTDPTPSAGTADEPYQGTPPEGDGANHMYGVDVHTGVDSTVVSIVGDGQFYYSTFTLQNPDRFVLDLSGVVNSASVTQIAVEDERVERVRLAQFRQQPDLVARVVVDLRTAIAPSVEASASGLELTFGDLLASSAEEPDVLEAAGFADESYEAPTASEWEPIEETTAEIEPDSPVEETVDSWADTAAEESEWDDSWTEEAEPVAEVIEEAPVEEDPQFDNDADLAAESEPTFEAAVVEAATPAAEPMATPAVQTAAVDVSVQPAAVEPQAPAYEAPAEEVAWEESTDEAWEESTDDAWDAPAAEAQVAAVMPEPEPEPWQDDAEEVEAPQPAERDVTLSIQESGSPAVSAAPPVIEARTVTPDRTYEGEAITMSLKDADIKDVLRSFAQLSGLNVVVQPNVAGTVTVELTEVPWDQALEQVLKINSLGYELEGNIMRIAPIAQLRSEAEEQQRLRAAQALSIPLRTIVRRVSYAQASQVARVLASGGGASIMSQRGSVVVDNRTNTLIIKELPTFIDSVIAIIEQLDIPEPQVMIEARIIETTKRFSRTLGIDWSFNGVSSAATGNTTGLQFPNNGAVDGGVQLLTGARNGFLDISLGNVLNTFSLDAVLQAAENEGLINILSAPKIATLNNEKASIQSGLQIPIQTVANNTVSVQFVNATLRLDVTPHVTAEGTVLMDISIQKREPQLAFAVVGASNAPISTKDAKTRVIVRDGGTTVIGGIYQVSSDQGEDRVPGLASIPILGHLFKNKRRDDENEELLIFITPRVVKL